MGIHPNAILLLVLTPDDLPMKTYRKLMDKYGTDESCIEIESRIESGKDEYTTHVMEGGYWESYQISASEGDIVIFDMVTYGYGEKIDFDRLVIQKEALERWAKTVCKELNCSYEIYVTANYW